MNIKRRAVLMWDTLNKDVEDDDAFSMVVMTFIAVSLFIGAIGGFFLLWVVGTYLLMGFYIPLYGYPSAISFTVMTLYMAAYAIYLTRLYLRTKVEIKCDQQA